MPRESTQFLGGDLPNGLPLDVALGAGVARGKEALELSARLGRSRSAAEPHRPRLHDAILRALLNARAEADCVEIFEARVPRAG